MRRAGSTAYTYLNIVTMRNMNDILLDDRSFVQLRRDIVRLSYTREFTKAVELTVALYIP